MTKHSVGNVRELQLRLNPDGSINRSSFCYVVTESSPDQPKSKSPRSEEEHSEQNSLLFAHGATPGDESDFNYDDCLTKVGLIKIRPFLLCVIVVNISSCNVMRRRDHDKRKRTSAKLGPNDR